MVGDGGAPEHRRTRALCDWFEQGDVWAKIAALRPVTSPLPPERVAELAPAARQLMTTDARSLCRPDGPLHAHGAWVTAFERAGATLADLAGCGAFTRGLRAVMAVLFFVLGLKLLGDGISILAT